jgi:hypothetical protein
MSEAVYKILVDWNGDGDFVDANEDITDDVMSLEMNRGRDYASQLTGRSTAGSMTATLENSSGKYNSFNTSSAIFGSILPGRAVQVRTDGGQFPYTFPHFFGSTLWTGFLDKIEPQPSLHNAHRAILRATGPLAKISQKKIDVAMTTDILTSDAVDDVLDAAGWPAGDREIATGLTTMKRWWANGKAITALREIEQSENGFVWETNDGNIAYNDRQFRMTNAKSLTSQATYSDAGNTAYSTIEQADPIREIFNIVDSGVQTYTVGSLAVLWTLSESGASSPLIEAGATRTWVGSYPNASSAVNAASVNAWTTLVENTDYEANSAADGSAVDKSSVLTVTLTKYATSITIQILNNDAAGVYLTKLQARGTPVIAADIARVVTEDATSKALYGERVYPISGAFIPTTDEAEDYNNFVLAIYKDPTPVLKVTISGNRDDAHMMEVLTRDISDRVTVVATGNSGLGINEAFFVETIKHRVDSHMNHWTTFNLAPVGSFAGFWVVGYSVGGTDMMLAY